ncbi:MAG TPA: hypothetical protein VK599_00435 [Streptosporangiaceae bacterium]|nr:hypothetical protein [Streptosporangiaceae bacterium]
MKITRTSPALAGAALTAMALLAAAGCSSAPAAIAAHGTVAVDYTAAGGDNLSDGSQVVIVNSAGTVVGNGTLAIGHAGAAPFNLGMEDDFTFTVTVPGGLPRYGIQVGGAGHGTVWETAAQMKAGPGLSIDETTGGL